MQNYSSRIDKIKKEFLFKRKFHARLMEPIIKFFFQINMPFAFGTIIQEFYQGSEFLETD